jgi:hypothetical protein
MMFEYFQFQSSDDNFKEVDFDSLFIFGYICNFVKAKLNQKRVSIFKLLSPKDQMIWPLTMPD